MFVCRSRVHDARAPAKGHFHPTHRQVFPKRELMKSDYPPVNALDWASIQPFVDALLATELTPETTRAWLQKWSDLESVLDEAGAQIYREITENTANEEASARFEQLVRDVFPHWRQAEQKLKEQWLAVSGYEPDQETAQIYRRFRAETELFHEKNIPIITDLQIEGKRYQEIIGGLSIDWQGEKRTIPQAEVLLSSRDETEREQVWHRSLDAYLQQRSQLNELFMLLLDKRRQLARNAGYPDYRAYAWIERGRFDYTPDDCLTFHHAIEQEVVPLATEIYQTLAGQLGMATLRATATGIGSPWMPTLSPHEVPLQPFSTVAELEAAGQRIFDSLAPELGAYFAIMREGFLDLASRPNKAPGGYMNSFPVSGKAYIFMNAAGSHRNFRTLMHEAGHAFHFFEAFKQQRLIWNYHSPMEFSETASMSMEQLSMPYWRKERGGVYDEADYHRAVVEHLMGVVTFLPYMAVVDKFQHWLYTRAPEKVTPHDLDARWSELWQRFLPGIDYSGLEAERDTGWQRKGHIFSAPFYYIEYGLAQLGALQVWRNALADEARAIEDYRRALAAGYTRTLPQLFQLANARFSFDASIVGEMMALIRSELEKHQ
jgi:oligoendopeptidase F